MSAVYTSIRVLNYDDFSQDWIYGQLLRYMSIFGYKLTGTCEVPLQYEFIFDITDVEPSLDELKNNFVKLIDGADLELERYEI